MTSARPAAAHAEAAAQDGAVIGRDAELGLLDRMLCEARQGRGGAVFLVGEEGAGKSCLALEFCRRAARAGARVLRGRTSSTGPAVPLRPLAEALQRFLSSQQNGPALELGPYRGVLGQLVRDVDPDGAGRAEDFVIALAEAITRLTAAAGRDRGCLLMLEDLQDADPATLAVVEYLADNLDRQPAVLVATIRADPSDALDLARAMARRSSAAVVELGPLAAGDIRLLAARLLRLTAADVPADVLSDLVSRSGGNPMLAVELLRGGGKLPAALVRFLGRRVDRLGPGGRQLLTVAAMLGSRFPLPVVAAVTEHGEHDLLGYLRAAVAADLIRPDEPAPDWYAFTRPTIADALLDPLTPADRAWIASRAAQAIEALHAGLPGEWCELAVELHLTAGATATAARLLAQAGGRAFDEGRFGAAVSALSRAHALISDGAADLRVPILDRLLAALAHAGHIDRALQLANAGDELDRPDLDVSQTAMLRTRLGWLACVCGRHSDGVAHLAAARALLGPRPARELAASIDVVTARLALQRPAAGGDQAAEATARRAAAGAERAGLPALACEAWLVVGVLARGRDVEAGTACVDRAEAIAWQHDLPSWRMHALAQRGVNDWLSRADTGRLRQARRLAGAREATLLACGTDLNLALCEVFLGRYGAARRLIDSCRTSVAGLRLAAQLALVSAVLAAHQGRRGEMEQAIGEFMRGAGEGSRLTPLLVGLAPAFCALLEEDHAAALAEVTRAAALDAASPASYPLVGRHGLQLLLEVLSGAAAWPQYRDAWHDPSGKLRWNQQFLLLAQAVLLGRDGNAARAEAAIARFEQVAAPFAMTLHLGLRLVAESAWADRWGMPVSWLRRADEYFQASADTAIASACRASLRKIGTVVPPRRRGAELVPAAVRRLGVTAREYEVLRLLAERPANKTIAERLYISPRTVEKHVASLMTKVGQPNRTRLCEFALALRDPATRESAG